MSQAGASEQQQHAEEEHKRSENKRLTKASGPSVAADENQKIGVADLKMQKNAPFLAERMKVFTELIEKQNLKYKGKQIVSILKSAAMAAQDDQENLRKNMKPVLLIGYSN